MKRFLQLFLAVALLGMPILGFAADMKTAAKPAPAPTPPADVTALSNWANNGNVALQWMAPAGAASFQVSYTGSDGTVQTVTAKPGDGAATTDPKGTTKVTISADLPTATVQTPPDDKAKTGWVTQKTNVDFTVKSVAADGKTLSAGVVTSAYSFSINDGDTAWLLISAAIVLMMTIPGLALFYGGMVRRKNILATIYYSLGSVLVVSVIWVIIQYTIGFHGFGNGGFIGDLSAFMHNSVLYVTGHGQSTAPWPGAPTIPESVYSMFQLMFAIITVALISGAIVERMTITGWLIFSAVWSLIVYAPLSHMVWAGGWLANANGLASWFGADAVKAGQGAIDFAGGLVVHTSSGISALTLCLILGPRVRYGKDPIIPNNIGFTFIGAALLWVGWFGFNAGSATSAGTLAGSAFFVTNTATAVAGLVWAIIEYIHHKKPTVIGACTGAVAGLVAITPASGYVDATGAIVIGVVVAIVCYMAVAFLKKAIGYDDALDTFGVHAVGGMTGALLTGVFCNPDIGTYFSGQAVAGVFYSGNWTQLGIQAVSVLVAVVLAIVGTIISYGIARIFTKMRVEPQEEITGLDQSLLGEKQGDR